MYSAKKISVFRLKADCNAAEGPMAVQCLLVYTSEWRVHTSVLTVLQRCYNIGLLQELLQKK
jgi:hypothetical protein